MFSKNSSFLFDFMIFWSFSCVLLFFLEGVLFLLNFVLFRQLFPVVFIVSVLFPLLFGSCMLVEWFVMVKLRLAFIHCFRAASCCVFVVFALVSFSSYHVYPHFWRKRRSSSSCCSTLFLYICAYFVSSAKVDPTFWEISE